MSHSHPIGGQGIDKGIYDPAISLLERNLQVDLRWYQKEAVDAAYKYLCEQQGNPVICLPTGSGKSLVIAELARRAVEDFQGRVLVLQHRKELISQNAEKVRKLLPIPIGEYSAGLRRYATKEDVVLCGIQSVYEKATLFDRRHLLIIDEVHLVPNDGLGMYQTFISDMRSINPDLRCVGLTATPYRTGEGALCKPDGVFQKICYEAPVKQLIDEGFLCPVTNKPADGEIDTSGLHLRYGEFIAKEMESLFGGMDTAAACKEIAEKTIDRNSVMVFCSSIRHAESVVDSLSAITGQRVEMVDGNTTPLERSAILKGFVDQKIKYLVNCDVLTTGFDAPCVDAIAILRATASPGLFAQIVGRGLRTHQSKFDCLVLDFGENIKRHGPIDAIDFGKEKSKKEASEEETELETKECPNCQAVVSVRKLLCDCGFRFAYREPKHDTLADTQAKIISEPETFEVESVYYALHAKEGKIPSMRVDYRLVSDGNMENVISEWVCVEHEGYAKRKALNWWQSRSMADFPQSAEEAVSLGRFIAVPKTITVQREGRYWRVLSAEIEEIPDIELMMEVVDEWEEEMPF